MKSSIPGFYNLSVKERLQVVKKFARLSDQDIRVLQKAGGLKLDIANSMIENTIGMTALPLGIATNFLINGKDYLIPMAIEEPSVVAAASNAAKMARVKGGFTATADESIMVGQIQVVDVDDIEMAEREALKIKNEIIKTANSKSKTLSRKEKGAKDVTVRTIEMKEQRALLVELKIDVGDAMGANVINTMCETVAPLIEDATGGRVLLRILSNYATERKVTARAVFGKEEIGEQTVNDVVLAYQFAEADQYRCTTHNKGVMNGIIAVANATAQDTRAIEAGAHSYASRNGKYSSLTTWTKNGNGDLVGHIEMPLAVGIVGGASSVHPVAKVCIKILRPKSAQELACIMASAALAQNFAALRALVSEGIQKGHMEMHARNVAIMAGAKGKMVDVVAKRIAKEQDVTVRRAKEVLKILK